MRPMPLFTLAVQQKTSAGRAETATTEKRANGARETERQCEVQSTHELPPGAQLAEGQWWTADYEGEPLVSFEADIAKTLGLAIGDRVTVNVIGRNITARIANLRKVQWGSLDINFVMVFSAGALQKAPLPIWPP